jgi:response regulator of citrate/malate metabolism
VLIRDALSAYLAATPPIAMLPPTDRADSLKELQEQVTDLTTRVKLLEEILTRWPQVTASYAASLPPPADREADRALPAADTSRAQPGGQRKLTPRQVRALRDKRQRGVSIPALMDEYGISRASVFRYLQSEKR